MLNKSMVLSFYTEYLKRIRMPSFAAKAYLVMALPLAIILSVIYAPLQAPDEASHLMRADIISNGEFGVISRNGISGGMVDINLKKYINIFGGLPFHYNTKVTAEMMHKATILKWNGKQEFTQIHGAMVYPPIIYFPQAVTLRLSKFIDLTIAQSYTLVRFINLLSVILLCSVLIYLLPLGREVAVVVGLLPMVLSQISTSVIEGNIFILMLCVLVCFLKGIDHETTWHKKMAWLSWFILALLIGSRPAFLPLVLLLIFVAVIRKSYKDMIPAMFFMSLACGWLVYAFISSGEIISSRSMGTMAHVVDFIFYPNHFFIPLFDTVSNVDYRDFYWRSFVGVLGWLDCPLPSWMYVVAFWALICGIIASSMSGISLKWNETYVVLIVFLLAILAIFFILWATFNDVGIIYIGGIQGRYFNALILLIGLLVAGKIKQYDVVYIGCWVVIIGYAMISYIELPKILLFRYWI